jgi:hypothetical protein
MSMAGIWLFHLGAIAIVDSRAFKIPKPEGEPNTGPMVWGIIMLSIAGLSAIEGLMSFFGWIGSLPFFGETPMILIGLLTSSTQLAVCVFMILRGISRLRRKAPGLGVLLMIFGICLAVLGLVSFFAQFALYY